MTEMMRMFTNIIMMSAMGGMARPIMAQAFSGSHGNVGVSREEKAVEAAQDKFWAEIARRYPEVKSGDFPPDATIIFNHACEEAVGTWLSINR